MKMKSLVKYTLIFFTLFTFISYADLFYSPKQYNSVVNEKVAAELEVKSLKRQLKNEKKKLGKELKDKESWILYLEKKIANAEKALEEEKKDAQAKYAALEKTSKIMKTKGSAKEKQLLAEMSEQQNKYEKKLSDIRAEMNKLRESHLDQNKKMRQSFDSQVSSLNSKIANLNEELDSVKELNKNQKRELSRMQAQASELEKQLKKEIDLGQIRLKKFHDKLIINLDDKISFNSGSANLKKEILVALNKIKKILVSYPENYIVIEGHTDNIPIRSKQFRSNWQLSTERALSVLQFILKEKSLDPRRFSAAGFGEYHPIVSNDTKENRALNRRVDIVLRPRVRANAK